MDNMTNIERSKEDLVKAAAEFMVYYNVHCKKGEVFNNLHDAVKEYLSELFFAEKCGELEIPKPFKYYAQIFMNQKTN